MFQRPRSRLTRRSRTDRRRTSLKGGIIVGAYAWGYLSQFASVLLLSYGLRRARRAALTDDMTGVGNRRAFDRGLRLAVLSASENGTEASLVMLDIDHFKALNDHFGHQTGDEALGAVGSSLRAAMSGRRRDGAVVARYGGEEFGVILPGLGASQAAEVADALRTDITNGWRRSALTASAGVATYPTHGASPQQLVDAADEALYASKRSGRNRTTVATLSGR